MNELSTVRDSECECSKCCAVLVSVVSASVASKSGRECCEWLLQEGVAE